jgi:uncharacterized membrane protein YgcG
MSRAAPQVSTRKAAWAALSIDTKIQLLWQMHDIMRSLDHQAWARESCAAASIPEDECTELNVALDMVSGGGGGGGGGGGSGSSSFG